MNAKEDKLKVARIAKREKEAQKAAETTRGFKLAQVVLMRRELSESKTSFGDFYNSLKFKSVEYNKYSDTRNVCLCRAGLIVKKGDILFLIEKMETLLALAKMTHPTQESLVEKINSTLERLRISLAKCNSYLNISSEEMSVIDVIKELTELRQLAKQSGLSRVTMKSMMERQLKLRTLLRNVKKD